MKLRAVSGHRDTGLDELPGEQALPAARTGSRSAAEQIGLPKLYSPVVRGKIGGPVVFSARLSSALPWTITVSGAGRPRVAPRIGIGPAVAWTWNSVGLRGRGATRGRWTRGRRCCRRGGSSAGRRCRLRRRAGPGTGGDAGRRVTERRRLRGHWARSRTRSASPAAVTATVADASGARSRRCSARRSSRARDLVRVLAGATCRTVATRSGSRSRPTTAARRRTTAAFTDRPHARVRHGVPCGDLAERRRRRRCADGSSRSPAPGQVTVTILAPDGSTVATLLSGALAAGDLRLRLGRTRLADGSTAPDGHYQVQVVRRRTRSGR